MTDSITRQAWRTGAPFLGIAERPYDQAGLQAISWPEVDPEYVRFSVLWLTQKRLSIPALFGMDGYSTDLFPRAVRCAGELYLEDGHHRAVCLSMRGAAGTDMRVLDASALARPYEHIR
jgi:hypothetical protein